MARRSSSRSNLPPELADLLVAIGGNRMLQDVRIKVHGLLQLLFGWYDSHLHRFALGTSVWDPNAESFLNEFDVEEDEDEGAPEVEVRLDEVLAEPGDVLRYCYDYGDDWSHTLKLEKVKPGACERPRVLAGKHEAPEEDSGGIWAWNEDPDLEPLDLDELDEELAAEWAADGRRTQ